MTISEADLRRQMEAAEAKYRSLVEALPAVVYAAEAGALGHWSYVSPQIESLLGFTPDEWRADAGAWLRSIHPDDRDAVLAAEERLILTGRSETTEYRMFRNDGRMVWVSDHAALVRSEDGAIVVLQGLLFDITAQKEAEDELLRSDAHNRAVLNSALDCVITADHEGRILFFNRMAEATFGYRDRDVIGKDLAEVIVPPMYREAHRQALRRYVETREPRMLGKRVELVAQRADGSEFPIELALTAIEQGGMPVFTAFLRDVTEQQRSNEVRRATARRFRALVQNSADCITVVGPDARVVYCSPSIENMLGYKPEELEESVGFDFVHPDDAETVIGLFMELLDLPGSSTGFSFRALHKDGSWRWIEAVATNLLQDPDVGGVVANFHDVTTQRESQQARDRLLAIIEATSDFVGLLEPSGKVMYLNRAARELLGVDDEDDVSRLSADEVGVGWVTDGSASRPDVWSGEATITTRTGGTVPVSQVVVSHRHPDGSVDFFSTIARDLTEHKELESRLVESQKMDAIGRLAGGIAHDFNNLLAVILNYAAFLKEDLDERDPRRDDLREIESAAERGARLVRQLLAFSRKEATTPRVVDLNAVVAEMEKLLRRMIGEDVELSFQTADDLWSIELDYVQLEQVLINLVVNARDAMPDGGKLSVTTSNETVTEKRSASAVEPGTYVCLAVSDTGTGMPEDVKAHIFEPFFTTKGVGKGTGLGLPTVYGIVQQAGGHISVDSQVGRGTRFRILFPALDIAPDDPHVRQMILGGVSGKGKDATILLVEDEAPVRTLVERMLRQQGFTVLAVGSGAEALEIARDHHGRIDLLLTDVVMPEMSGKILAQRPVNSRPGFKTIYMSGYTEDVVVERGKVTSDEAFIGKPFTIQDLLAKVEEVLG